MMADCFVCIPEETYVYLYILIIYMQKEPQIVKAVTDYSTTIHASVRKRQWFTCQFHPEKSSKRTENILENFCKLKGELEMFYKENHSLPMDVNK